MRAFPCLLLLTLLLLLPASGQQPSFSLTPVRISHINEAQLTVKIVGPTSKVLKLGPDSAEVVLLAPGSYHCLYYFRDAQRENDTYTKSATFFVKPWNGNPWSIHEVWAKDYESADPDGDKTKEILASSAAEFQNAKLNASASSMEGDDQRRIKEVTAIVTLEYVEDDETPAEVSRRKRFVFGYINRYVMNSLSPKLRAKGIKINYLGIQPQEPETITSPLLLIACTESKGGEYATDDERASDAHGIHVDCKVSLKHPQLEGGQVWQANLTGSTEAFLFANPKNLQHSLHLNALQNLGVAFRNVLVDLVDWAPRATANPVPRSQPTRRTTRRTGTPGRAHHSSLITTDFGLGTLDFTPNPTPDPQHPYSP